MSRASSLDSEATRHLHQLDDETMPTSDLHVAEELGQVWLVWAERRIPRDRPARLARPPPFLTG
jgi:hypothetical protein